jgi:hypothetical protein
MPFDQEEIDRLSPSARVEVQDYYVCKHFADRHVATPERRRGKLAMQAQEPGPAADDGSVERVERRSWPRVWYRNDSSRPAAACASRLTIEFALPAEAVESGG